MRAFVTVLALFWASAAAHDATVQEKLLLNPYESNGVLRHLQASCSSGTFSCGSGPQCSGCCPNSCSSCNCRTCTNCSSSPSLSGGAIGGIVVTAILVLIAVCVRARACCRQAAPVPAALHLAAPLAPPPPPHFFAGGYPDPALHHRVAVLVEKSGPLGMQLVPAPGGVGAQLHSLSPGALVEGALPGDRLFSVGGVNALGLPLGGCVALLQEAPRPLALEFLRRTAPPPAQGQDDPALPTIVKGDWIAAAPAPPAVPDPALHHTVAATITRAGLLGLGLAPGPGGAGAVVDKVNDDAALTPLPQVNDLIYSIKGRVLMMAPFPDVIGALQGSPRPAPILFLRRNAALPPAF